MEDRNISIRILPDPVELIIIYEEMPAYFAGQKSFDEVTKLINNRATTYLNERG